jgi:Flp pilus assembly protein TadG
MMNIASRAYPRFRSSEEGATAVEAAIVISAFVVLTLGIVEFAQIYWTWNTMLLATEDAGRYAMLMSQNPSATFPTCTATTVPLSCSSLSPPLPSNFVNCTVAQANQALSTYPAATATVSVSSCAAASAPNPATITLQGTFTFNIIGPTSLPPSVTMTSQLTVPLI